MAPVAVLVSVEIAPQRLEEFKKIIKIDADESLKEAGCLRFDVWKDPDSDTKYFFYECYNTSDDVKQHKQTPHYKMWADFKATGAVTSYSVKLHEGFIISAL